MDIVELKQEIENNTYNKEYIICVCKSDSARFVAYQYLHTYANNSDLEVVCSEDVINHGGFFDISPSVIHLVDCEELNEFTVTGNLTWIICKKISKQIESEYPEAVVKIPKLEEWQVKDYVTSVTGITDEQASELMKIYTDIRKLDIEISKLSIFKNNLYNELHDQLVFQEDKSIFELSNALIQRDKKRLSEVVKSGLDGIEPFPLMGILSKNLRHVIDIQLAKNPTSQSTGLSEKQFWAVRKYSCGHYNRDELLYLFKFINELDLKIKQGNLDTNNVVNYIISEFLKFMR